MSDELIHQAIALIAASSLPDTTPDNLRVRAAKILEDMRTTGFWDVRAAEKEFKEKQGKSKLRSPR